MGLRSNNLTPPNVCRWRAPRSDIGFPGQICRNSNFLRPLALAEFLVTASLIVMLTGGCTSPAIKFDREAAALGFEKQLVVGATFQHVLFWKRTGPNLTLHVYLDGDGTPVHRGEPENDPTSRNTLMLGLLALDPGPAVYVGRPCYHGMVKARECTNELWTIARYSDSVVSSLVAVVNTIADERGKPNITLLGLSGGGTLAFLLAERIPDTYAVVTIGANFDIDAWADYHGYARLTASLNPATRPPLPDAVLQRHYVGSRDRIVPTSLALASFRSHGIRPIIVKGYDHMCCWTRLWPSILKELQDF